MGKKPRKDQPLEIWENVKILRFGFDSSNDDMENFFVDRMMHRKVKSSFMGWKIEIYSIASLYSKGSFYIYKEKKDFAHCV